MMKKSGVIQPINVTPSNKYYQQFAPKSNKPLDPFEESLRVWSAQYTPSLNREPFVVRSGSETRKYWEIKVHPVVKIGLDFIKIGTFWPGFDIHPGNDYTIDKGKVHEDFDKEVIEEIKNQIDTWKLDSFKNNLESLLDNALTSGFVGAAEKLFEQADDGHTKMWGIRTHTPFEFELYTDPYTNLNKFQWLGSGQFVVGDELTKFVTAPWPYLSNGNHYGVSELQSILHDVKALEIIEEAEIRGIQALTVRPIIHWYLANATNQDELALVREALQKSDMLATVSLPSDGAFRENALGELQKNHLFEVLEDRASHDGVELIRDVIDMLQKRILRNMGIPDDLGFSTSTVGSYAKAKEEMNMFLARLKRYQEWVENLVNKQILPDMITPNFELPEGYRLPQFRFNQVEEDKLQTMSDTLMKLYDSGHVDRKYLQETLSLPETASHDNRPEEIGTTPTKPTIEAPKPEIDENGDEIQTEQDVEVTTDAVLNGAQVSAATTIVMNVASGVMPRDAGLGQLEVLFNLKPEQALRIMGSAGNTPPVLPPQKTSRF